MDNLGNFPPHFWKQLEWIEKVTNPIINIIPPALSRQLELIDKLFPPGLRDLLNDIENQQDQLKEAIIALANNGWFVGLSLPLRIQKQVLEKISEYPEQVDSILCDYYESNLESMEQTLITGQPDRSSVIRDIFAGHKAKLYSLTVPTAFAQVDGICVSSEFQGHLFMRPRGSELSQFGKNIIEADLCDYQKLLFSPFMMSLPIAFNMKERESSEVNKLNRHTVIHGESTDYGNRVNSLKSIVLLCYVSEALTKHLRVIPNA
ncbi:TPA: hypothetical protein ACQYCV_004544 [Vibrio parahaemolyticus]|uniref:hypothetical protein n=1 Tax=Vibrio parahaemolyticus TaxID=670 RepID=UPI002878FDD6|nr:hypothetical protein [Vibrio parahaemolyticus]MDS1868777.1 hypothetical protein [Vibrio parahaemolyticus]HCG7063022.1 hypothetical protein [Vibrio parahaemolyticus]HCG8084821.1 hypothetical protein [Vibrio parahaemolyticus]